MAASAIYGNMSNQASMQKAAKNQSSSQQKFLSKSPNPQSKMMANTNYGKFKGINMNANAPVGGGAHNQNAVYARGAGTMAAANQNNGQYLPKLGPNGMSSAAMASSHAQLPQFSQQATMAAAPHAGSSLNAHHQGNMNYQQQLLQQNAHMSSQQNLGGAPGMMMGASSSQVGRPSTYQQMQRESQSALMHQLQRSKQMQPGGGVGPGAGAGPHASSQQVIKTVSSQQSSHLNLGGMQSAQGLNFRQNLNMSLQQIQSHKNKRDTAASSSLGRNQRQGAK